MPPALRYFEHTYDVQPGGPTSISKRVAHGARVVQRVVARGTGDGEAVREAVAADLPYYVSGAGRPRVLNTAGTKQMQEQLNLSTSISAA